MTGNLAAAAGGIHDVLRHGITGGMPAQALDDLDALGHRGAEVAGAMHQVALVQVIRAHPDAHQVLHQLALDVDIIVDTRQQDGLVAERDAGPGQFITGFGQLFGDLVRMVDVDIHPERVEFLQHIAQFSR